MNTFVLSALVTFGMLVLFSAPPAWAGSEKLVKNYTTADYQHYMDDGLAFARKGQFDKALKKIELARPLIASVLGKDSRDYMDVTNLLARLHGDHAFMLLFSKQNIDTSGKHVDRSIELFSSLPSKGLSKNYSFFILQYYLKALIKLISKNYESLDPIMKVIKNSHIKKLDFKDPRVQALIGTMGGTANDLWKGRQHKLSLKLYDWNLTILEKSFEPDDTAFVPVLIDAGNAYFYVGNYATSGKYYTHLLNIARSLKTSNNELLVIALANLANNYSKQGLYSKAEPMLKQAIKVLKKIHGPYNDNIGLQYNNLAELYKYQGRNIEAEYFFLKALKVFKHYKGNISPHLGRTYNNLGLFYGGQGRYKEARQFYIKALTFFERGTDKEAIATTLEIIAKSRRLDLEYKDGGLVMSKDIFRKCLAAQKRALKIREGLPGDNSQSIISSQIDLGILHDYAKKFKKATVYFKKALENLENDGLKRSYLYNYGQFQLALVYLEQGNYDRAELLFHKVISGINKSEWMHYDHIIRTFSKLGIIAIERDQNLKKAISYFDKMSELGHKKSLIGRGVFPNRGSSTLGLQAGSVLLVAAIDYIEKQGKSVKLKSDFIAKATFKAFQELNRTSASNAISNMSTRLIQDEGKLAIHIRYAQDLVLQWRKLKEQIKTIKRNVTDTDNERLTRLTNQLNSIAGNIQVAGQIIEKRFPQYSELVSPKPVNVNTIQSLLKDDEALLKFHSLSTETYIWLITKKSIKWVRIPHGDKWVSERVSALRCGLDKSGWEGKAAKKCAKLLDIDMADRPLQGDLLPFDITRAHSLYKTLFGQVEDLMKGKNLLIVPSGSLTKLPFQILVTEKSDMNLKGLDAYKAASWLGKRHALTTFPTVASLKSLRKNTKISKASKQLIGFANPLLDGGKSEVESAQQARAIKGCTATKEIKMASLRAGVWMGAKKLGDKHLSRIEAVKRQSPLPDTANSLCRVARSSNANFNDIYLGKRATEARIRKLNRDGGLKQFKTVIFSTHAMLAGELDGTKEPGLILTPPNREPKKNKDGTYDDGYLSASEITSLKLDADWVVLSACNTAGGDEKNSQALSGLVRAFFYAGTRSLLVSHWYVNSRASSALISRIFEELRKNKEIGRAHALRRSMIAMINEGEDHQAHPMFWAPFVVVGAAGGVDIIETIQTTKKLPKLVIKKQIKTKKQEVVEKSKERKKKVPAKKDWKKDVFGSGYY